MWGCLFESLIIIDRGLLVFRTVSTASVLGGWLDVEHKEEVVVHRHRNWLFVLNHLCSGKAGREVGACATWLSYSWLGWTQSAMEYGWALSVALCAVTGIVDEERVRPASCCWAENKTRRVRERERETWLCNTHLKCPRFFSCTPRDYLNARKAVRTGGGGVLLQNHHLFSLPPSFLWIYLCPSLFTPPSAHIPTVSVLCFESPLPLATSRCCFTNLPLPSFLCAKELSQEFVVFCEVEGCYWWRPAREEAF